MTKFLVVPGNIAQQIRGEKFDRFWEVEPILLDDGRYVLPADMLKNEHYSDLYELLKDLEQIDDPF